MSYASIVDENRSKIVFNISENTSKEDVIKYMQEGRDRYNANVGFDLPGGMISVMTCNRGKNFYISRRKAEGSPVTASDGKRYTVGDKEVFTDLVLNFSEQLLESFPRDPEYEIKSSVATIVEMQSEDEVRELAYDLLLKSIENQEKEGNV